MSMEYKIGAERRAALVLHENRLWLARLGSVSILAAGALSECCVRSASKIA